MISGNKIKTAAFAIGTLFGSIPVVAQTLDTNATIGTAPIVHAIQLKTGWNLIGNGTNLPVGIAGRFGSYDFPKSGVSENVVTVWKWNPVYGRWAFYAPSMTAADLSTYATSKGYEVLGQIWPGEGYWVNTKAELTLSDTGSVPVKVRANSLVRDWNLVSSGETIAPSGLNKLIGGLTLTDSTIPLSMTSLWAWDNSSSGWYFYAPALEKDGTLTSYANSKNYKDFAAISKSLEPGMGFWLNAPNAAPSPTVSKTPLEQAKAMVQDLRAIGNVFSTVQKNGFLDLLSVRLKAAGNTAVLGETARMTKRIDALHMAAALFADVDAGRTSKYETINSRSVKVDARYRYGNNVFNGATVCSLSTSAGPVICEIADPAIYNMATAAVTTRIERYTVAKSSNPYAVTVTQSNVHSLNSGTYNLADLLHTASGVAFALQSTGPSGATYSETRTSTLLPLAGVVAGDFPPAPSSSAVKDRYAISVLRNETPSAGGVYTYNLQGSLQTLGSADAVLSTINLEQGSLIEVAESADGVQTGTAPKKILLMLALNTPDIRLAGKILATDFSRDADNQQDMPGSLDFHGTATEITANGAGQFFQVRVSNDLRDWNLYRSLQPESETNLKKQRLGISAVVQAPNRQPLNLTFSSTRIFRANAISGRFAFGPHRSLGFSFVDPDFGPSTAIGGRNHDDIRLIEQADKSIKIIAKDGATLLGVINAQSSQASFTDGSFETLQ